MAAAAETQRDEGRADAAGSANGTSQRMVHNSPSPFSITKCLEILKISPPMSAALCAGEKKKMASENAYGVTGWPVRMTNTPFTERGTVGKFRLERQTEAERTL